MYPQHLVYALALMEWREVEERIRTDNTARQARSARRRAGSDTPTRVRRLRRLGS